MSGGSVLFAAGRAACGPFPADSTLHRFSRHVLVDYSSRKADKGNSKGQKVEKDGTPRRRDGRPARASTTP